MLSNEEAGLPLEWRRMTYLAKPRRIIMQRMGPSHRENGSSGSVVTEAARDAPGRKASDARPAK